MPQAMKTVRGWSARQWGIAVLFVALAIRLGVTANFVGLGAPPDVEANYDSTEYELLAYNLATGEGYAFSPGVPSAARPPGTALTLLLPYTVFGRSYLAAHVWIVLLSAFTCLIAAWVGAQVADRAVGWVAGAWLALYPGHWYYSMHFLSEPVFGFWLALAVALFMVAVRRGHPWAIAGGGIAWAMAILTRVEQVLTIPIAWALFLFASPATKRLLRRSLVIETGIVLALLSVWVGRNAVVMGAPSLSLLRGYALWGAHNEETFTDSRSSGSWVAMFNEPGVVLGDTELERDRQAWAYGMTALRSHLRDVPRLLVMKLWRFVSPFFDTPNRLAMWVLAGGWIFTAPFVVAGLVRLARAPRNERPGWTVLLVPILATIAMCLVFYGSPRFRDAVAPLFVVIAARGALYSRVGQAGTGEQASSTPR
jgi:4-amino-4-deoxy-L-arabinose transferase-like glycosyltransferase